MLLLIIYDERRECLKEGVLRFAAVEKFYGCEIKAYVNLIN